jgi:microcystin-dependent protein
MALDIPLPTASPNDDPAQYIPLLLSAIEGFLLARDVWEEADYDDARMYMEQLQSYVVDCFGKCFDLTPIGTLAMWITSTAPTGWVKCNGAAISRTTYADLFALFGTTFGAGNGTTTFNLPDLRDLSPYGVGSLIAVAGQTTGTVNETLTTLQIPAHNHAVTDPGHAHAEQITNAAFKGGAAGGNSTFQGATTNSAVRATTDSATTGLTTQNTGGGNSHNNVHPVIGVHYIVFAGV